MCLRKRVGLFRVFFSVILSCILSWRHRVQESATFDTGVVFLYLSYWYVILWYNQTIFWKAEFCVSHCTITSILTVCPTSGRRECLRNLIFYLLLMSLVARLAFHRLRWHVYLVLCPRAHTSPHQQQTALHNVRSRISEHLYTTSFSMAHIPIYTTKAIPPRTKPAHYNLV